MSEAFLFLIKAILDLISLAILIAFFFRLLKVDFYNPLVQGLLKISNIFTSPFKLLIKPTASIDLTGLLTAYFFQVLGFFLITLAGNSSYEITTMLLWAGFSITLIGLNITWWVLLVGIIISWVAPMSVHPAVSLLKQMSEKICTPFRLILPPMGGLDFSPILAFLLLQFILRAVLNLSVDFGLPIGLSLGT